jgi:mono/diheme cytochrome c family protein
MSFREMDDEDLASIVVYLRSIPAVNKHRERSQYVFPLNVLVKTMPQPLASHAPNAPRTTPEARGKYLVRTMSGCQDCHTPQDDKGNFLTQYDLAGGGEFHNVMDNMKPFFSLNITPDPSGIAHYDEAMFIQTFRTGRVAGRLLNPTMPFENYKGMTDEDLKDIFAYLKTVPPVKHRVSNTDAAAKCPVCGRVHGLGDLNQGESK